jgi:RNA polymerase sigma-70 factor (ECF subfamily)
MTTTLTPPIPRSAARRTSPDGIVSDDELMSRINHGHADQSLQELASRYGPRLLSFVRDIVRDSHLADDVLQEVLAKIYTKSHLYRIGTNFHAWLFEIARNQALTALRSRRHLPKPVGSLEPAPDAWGSDSNPLESLPDDQVDRRLEEAEFMTAFHEAVQRLPRRYRDIFELCVQRGVKYREAAQQLGIPTGTVAIRLMRARQRLYRELSPHLDRLRRPPACLQ